MPAVRLTIAHTVLQTWMLPSLLLYSQHMQPLTETLKRDLTRYTVGLSNKTEQEVLLAIKSLTVRDENVIVSRVALNDMRQDREETVRSFCARLCGQSQCMSVHN